MKLSILIPVYNEKNTIEAILKKVEKVKLSNIKKEIIIVDNFSTDGTREILQKLENKYKIIYHERNLGKGTSIRTGLKHVTGDFIIIQDADLEYDPEDYPKLLKPILEGTTDVVYGSRVLSQQGSLKEKHSFVYNLFYSGNLFLTFLTNLLYGSYLTDMATCYKVFKREVMNDIFLRATGFDFDPEITAKFLKKGHKIVEVPISYYSRSFEEGKKITVWDGAKIVWYLIKYKIID